jgi:hypothetical protein
MAWDDWLAAALQPLPDDRKEWSVEPEAFRELLNPLAREAEVRSTIHAPVRSRAIAVNFLDKVRLEMTCNASSLAAAFFWGLLAGFRAVGHLTVEDVEAYRHRVRECPGHGGGQTFCAFCGDVCRVCGGPDPCQDEECMEARFGDGPRDKGHPPAPVNAAERIP